MITREGVMQPYNINPNNLGSYKEITAGVFIKKNG